MTPTRRCAVVLYMFVTEVYLTNSKERNQELCRKICLHNEWKTLIIFFEMRNDS